MKLRKSIDNRLCVVFESNYHADKWEWLFGNILGMGRICYGQYDNAYCYM